MKLKVEKQLLKESKYKRYTFNIQCLPTDDLDAGEISLGDLPEQVLEALAEEIKNYPKNQIIVYED